MKGRKMGSSCFECLNCGGVTCVSVHTDCRDLYLGTDFRVSYVRCDDCGLVQQSPAPLDTSAFYDAYPVHSRKSRAFEVVRRALMSAPYFDASSMPDGSVLLDFGCGDGWYLGSLARTRLTLAGYEPDAEHAARLSGELGVPVFSDEAVLLDELAGQVDVVTMHFVLEHLVDLHGAFALVESLLKPGGRFYFVVPNIASWEARVFGRKWHSLDPPRHISFPDRAAVECLAAQHGMQMIEVRSRPFANGVAGSLAVLPTGRFSYPAFALSLPVGLLLSRLAPTGATGFLAERASVSGVL